MPTAPTAWMPEPLNELRPIWPESLLGHPEVSRGSYAFRQSLRTKCAARNPAIRDGIGLTSMGGVVQCHGGNVLRSTSCYSSLHPKGTPRWILTESNLWSSDRAGWADCLWLRGDPGATEGTAYTAAANSSPDDHPRW